MLWPRQLSWNTTVRQSASLADSREGHVRAGADVPLVRGKTGYSLWVLQQPKVVGCHPGLQVLPVRCFADQTHTVRCFAPVDMLVVEVANIRTGVWERRDGRRCKPRAWRFADVNDLVSCDVYAQALSL